MWIHEVLAHCRAWLQTVQETIGREGTNYTTLGKMVHTCPVDAGPPPFPTGA